MIIEGFEQGKYLLNGRKLFLICGESFDNFSFSNYIKKLNPVLFSAYTSNPIYEDVVNGVEKFRKSGCDTLLAVGGGSAIDVAKAIKYYSESVDDIIAIPTTAGSGAESTHFAVIYKDGIKQSIANKTLLPKEVILEPSVISSVPEYTRKVTMLDALCHAIECYWAKRATDGSRHIARQAICEILQNMESYLLNERKGNEGMLRASNHAGQAINITTTTAAHAMSYGITKLYGLAHGHAVALCIPEVWRINDIEIPEISLDEFMKIFSSLHLEYPISRNKEEEIEILTNSVNLDRLKNNPVDLSELQIRRMYERIIHES